MATETPREPNAPSRDGRLVQLLLQSGLAISALLMLAGLVVQLASGAHGAVSVKMFEIATAKVGTGTRLMALGILVLAFTPVFRVLMLVGLWTRERDWRFVGVAMTVVVVLAIAIAAGGG